MLYGFDPFFPGSAILSDGLETYLKNNNVRLK